MRKERLDRLLVQHKLVRSREEGRRLIMAGQVRVDGQVVDRPATRVPTSAEVTIVQRPRYVSRGGIKLEAALQQFRLDVTGMVCADVGASTGGFTDCLLQHGAARVYAIDVGYGQLAWKLRRDPRVVVMERVNARYLKSLPQPVDLVTVDVSFISLRLILPQVHRWLRPDGHVIPLIKPQFEAGPRDVGKGGIVKDPAVHRRVLRDLLTWMQGTGWETVGLMASPITGATGNVEFLAHLRPAGASGEGPPPAVEAWVEAVIPRTPDEGTED